ncbi:MAG TPA: recombinase RecA [Edaphobacter sp.]|nr:recombinase RecA [Edaphobacter sp.]
MSSAATIRVQIESALAAKIPSALTPQPRMVRPQAPTGIVEVDELLGGGLPIGAVTELVGAECTGRTSLAMTFLAGMTAANRVCAWVDASNAFDPVSAAAVGVDLKRLLWVRCAEREAKEQNPGPTFSLPAQYLIPAKPKKGLHGGGFGPHPREEVRGLSEAMHGLFVSRSAPPELLRQKPLSSSAPASPSGERLQPRRHRAKQYDAMERALRSMDLLLQTGGFSALVLDLASISPEKVSRIDLSTWHRYRVAAEKMQTVLLLLTQYPCAKSGSELQLQLSSADVLEPQSTVFCGIASHLHIARQRFAPMVTNVVPMRKPVQRVQAASWQNRMAWAGAR